MKTFLKPFMLLLLKKTFRFQYNNIVMILLKTHHCFPNFKQSFFLGPLCSLVAFFFVAALDWKEIIFNASFFPWWRFFAFNLFFLLLQNLESINNCIMSVLMLVIFFRHFFLLSKVFTRMGKCFSATRSIVTFVDCSINAGRTCVNEKLKSFERAINHFRDH